MADLTLRSVKGSALSFTEMDSNFLALDSDISGLFAASSTSDLSEGTNLYYTDARVLSVIDSDYISSRTNTTVGAQTSYKFKKGTNYPDSTKWGFNDSSNTGRLTQIDSGSAQAYIRFNRYNLNAADTSQFLKQVIVAGSRIYIQQKNNAALSTLLETTSDFEQAGSNFNVFRALIKMVDGKGRGVILEDNKEDIVMFQTQATNINDSSEVISIINSTVDKSFVDALNVDADTVDGFHGIGIYDSDGTLLNG